ncbi:hypothetical protein, partial [Amycolatopsis pithecellobii]
MCAACPVTDPCRGYARAGFERWGV